MNLLRTDPLPCPGFHPSSLAGHHQDLAQPRHCLPWGWVARASLAARTFVGKKSGAQGLGAPSLLAASPTEQ